MFPLLANNSHMHIARIQRFHLPVKILKSTALKSMSINKQRITAYNLHQTKSAWQLCSVHSWPILMDHELKFHHLFLSSRICIPFYSNYYLNDFSLFTLKHIKFRLNRMTDVEWCRMMQLTVHVKYTNGFE